VEKSITSAVEGAVATITLNRPQTLNAVSVEMARAMRNVTVELAKVPDLRVIVLQGAGAAFMAGGDIQDFQGPSERANINIAEIIDHFHDFILWLQESSAIVIGAIHGAAAGGGFSLAISTDITICAESARFSPAYRLLGTSPDGGCSFFLPHLVGSKKATEILFSGGSYTASEALQLGIVTAVVPDAEHKAAVRRAAAKLVEQNAPIAAGATKAVLKKQIIGPLREHLSAEKRAFLLCASTPDFSEGVTAFLEKRRPRFVAAE
jgi:2-(1,2-epoxy-1,2-dihydrophenyl)acetyl-CoA isomerase